MNPRIVKFNGKYTESTYVVPDDETWAKVCAIEIKHRFESNGFYEPTPPKKITDEEQALLDTDPATIAALPKNVADELTAKQDKIRLRWNRELRYFDQETRYYAYAKRIAEAATIEDALAVTFTNRSGDQRPAAILLIQHYRDGEYDGYETLQIDPITW